MTHLRPNLTAVVLLSSVALAAACSSSSDESTNPGSDDGGVATDAASNSDAPSSVQDSAPTDSATIDASADAGSEADSTVAGGAPCEFSVSGGRTDPTTAAPYACSNGHLEQPNGSGDYTISFGGGFQTSAGEIVSLACTMSSATAPSAGAMWTLTTDAHSEGNCMLTATSSAGSATWAASANTATVTGSASITFTSASMTHGTVHPSDVYYTYQVTLQASLKGLSSGASDVTIQGDFTQTQLVSGS